MSQILGVLASMAGSDSSLRAAQRLRDEFRRATISDRDAAVAYAASVVALTSEAAR
jgi:hypothetical protein